MPLIQLRTSSKTGDPMEAGTGARIRIEFYDGKRQARRADLTDAEVEELLPFAEEVESRPGHRRSRADL